MDETIKETSKVKSGPKVEIFGEDVSSHKEELKDKDRCCERHFHDRFHFRHHHHHRGSLPWGLVLILIGLMFLLSNFGVLSPTVWSQVSHLWPILIILIGFDILIGHSEVSDIINPLIGLFIFATILGIVFLHTSPQIVAGLPQNIQNYLHAINNWLQIK